MATKAAARKGEFSGRDFRRCPPAITLYPGSDPSSVRNEQKQAHLHFD